MLRATTCICFVLLVCRVAQFQGSHSDLLLRSIFEVPSCLAESNQEPADVAFWKIDEYGAISTNEEQARLLEFARRLRGQPSTQAYIIAYGGRRSWPGEAIDRANCAKDYLVKKLGIAKRRIVSVDGGYQDQAVVALYMGENGAPPLASPTVNPREIQIIKVAKSADYQTHAAGSDIDLQLIFFSPRPLEKKMRCKPPKAS